MIIFPAIDIRGGQCVRLVKGDFAKETVFSQRPEIMAKRWEDEGGEYLHLVDLDGARAGQSRNLDVVEMILKTINIPVELGGGIRTMDNIKRVLEMGVTRVILGSIAVKDPELVKTACKEYGSERIVVGIDAKDGIVAVDGWGVSGEVKATELAKRMADGGVKHIIYTDISRDGTLIGVNAKATAEIAKVSGIKVVASGGVSSIEDIKLVKEYEQDGIEGVIVGKSIYTGALSLPEAIKVAKGE